MTINDSGGANASLNVGSSRGSWLKLATFASRWGDDPSAPKRGSALDQSMRVAVEFDLERDAPSVVRGHLVHPGSGETIADFELKPVNAKIWMSEQLQLGTLPEGLKLRLRLTRSKVHERTDPVAFSTENEEQASFIVAGVPTPLSLYMCAMAGRPSGLKREGAFFLSIELLTAPPMYDLNHKPSTEVTELFEGWGIDLAALAGVNFSELKLTLTKALSEFTRSTQVDRHPPLGKNLPTSFDSLLRALEMLLAVSIRPDRPELDTGPTHAERERLVRMMVAFASGQLANASDGWTTFNCEPNGPFFFLFTMLGAASVELISEQSHRGDAASKQEAACRVEWWQAFTFAATVALDPYREIYASARPAHSSRRYEARYRQLMEGADNIGTCSWPWGRVTRCAEFHANRKVTWARTLQELHIQLRSLLLHDILGPSLLGLSSHADRDRKPSDHNRIRIMP